MRALEKDLKIEGVEIDIGGVTWIWIPDRDAGLPVNAAGHCVWTRWQHHDLEVRRLNADGTEEEYFK